MINTATCRRHFYPQLGAIVLPQRNAPPLCSWYRIGKYEVSLNDGPLLGQVYLTGYQERLIVWQHLPPGMALYLQVAARVTSLESAILEGEL